MKFPDYLNSPDARRVAAECAVWGRTEHGALAMLQLCLLASAHVSGALSARLYDLAVGEIADANDLPIADAKVMGRGQYEAMRPLLIASGLTWAKEWDR